MPVIWLTPRLPISIDPNGIPTGVPILDDDPMAGEVVAIMPEVDTVEQEGLTPVETVGFVDDGPNVDVDPKTPALGKLEKVELSPATEEVGAMGLGARTLIQPVAPTLPEELIVPMGRGVSIPDALDIGVAKPPGSSSRAPRGMPDGPTELGSEPNVPRGMPVGPTELGSEPNVERGEAGAKVGVVVGMTCARLGTLGSADIIMAINRPVILRIGFHLGCRPVEGSPDL
jgi:hypothetical protein